MSYMEAWNWIRNNWSTPTWKPIPNNVSSVIGLNKHIGIYNATLVTMTGAKCAEMSYRQISHKS
jgi:hypothetical protein